MKNHYVYETTNLINGKKYIGKRSCDCEIEDDSYLGSGKYFKRAVKKYGKENFQKKILEICNSEQHAFEKEIYYIAKFNAVENENYYNIADGGQGATWIHGKSEEELNAWKQKMSNSRKGRIITPEWKAKILETRRLKGIGVGKSNPMYGRKSPRSKPVVMISFDGKEIKIFHNAFDANEFLHKDRSSSLINRVCRQKGGTAYEYLWLFKEDYDKMMGNHTYSKWFSENINRYILKNIKANRNKVQKNSRIVYQLNQKTFEIINTFESVILASDFTGIHDTSISRVCNHGCNTAGGYCWCYKEEYDEKTIEEIKMLYTRKTSDSEKFRNRPQTKIPVYCITTNQKFDGACDAVEFFGLCKGTKIQDVCKGKRKYAGRHPETNEPLVWMYYEDYLKKEAS